MVLVGQLLMMYFIMLYLLNKLVWFKSPLYYGVSTVYLSGEWGIHLCFLEGAIKVTTLDKCPLVSVKVNLVAIARILILEGCHQKDVSFHLVRSPGCLLVWGYLWLYRHLGSCGSVHCVSHPLCPGGHPWSTLRSKAVSWTSVA